MSKNYDPDVTRPQQPDPATVQAARVKAQQQNLDNGPRPTGTSGRLKTFPGNH